MLHILSVLISIAGSLCLFLYGMQLMSNGLQKAAGDRLAKFFSSIAKGPFMAMIMGLFSTVIVQSSSAITVMVVSFANANIINLQQAIGIIMGANIGTTITGWIVSLFGFKFSSAVIALPALAVGFIMMQNRREYVHDHGVIFLGIAFLFLGLDTLNHSIPELKASAVEPIVSYFDNDTMLGHTVVFMLGIILTVIVHSSSALTAIIIALLLKGVISFEVGAILTLGANVGTTVDVLLAFLAVRSTNAKRAAWAHILFNVIGAVICLLFINTILRRFEIFCTWIDLKDNGIKLAAFHTAFNLTAALVFFCFLKPYEKLIVKIVPTPTQPEIGSYRLEYVAATLHATPESNLTIAKNEISKMTSVVERTLQTYIDSFDTVPSKFDGLVELVKEDEELSDLMETEITKFLVDCGKATMVGENRENITALIKIVKELEHTADSVYTIIMLMQRSYRKKFKIRQEALEQLKNYAQLAMEFYHFTKEHINKRMSKQDLKEARKLEQDIDDERVRMREEAQEALEEGSEPQSEILVIDLVRHIEHIGDYCMRIATILRQLQSRQH